MYTVDNTINDLLADELTQKHFEYMMPMFFLEIVPEELRGLPIRELPEKISMPWGDPYLAEGVVEVVNQLHELADSENYEFVKLWAEETPEGYFPATDGSRNGIGILKFKKSFQQGRPVALIAPGGAYMTVAVSNEGIWTAKALADAGYAVAVTNYRCEPNRYPLPQEDLALAIKCVRKWAEEEGLLDDLLVMGYSAGGHLVASETCYAEEIDHLMTADLEKEFPGLAEKYKGISARADKVCLSYPVISLESDTHEQSMVNLTGGDQDLIEKLSIEKHVKADYPKAFVWACEDDASVPVNNATRMAEALKHAGVEHKCMIYPTGDHGIATAEGTSAEGWVNELVAFMKS